MTNTPTIGMEGIVIKCGSRLIWIVRISAESLRLSLGTDYNYIIAQIPQKWAMIISRLGLNNRIAAENLFPRMTRPATAGNTAE